MSEIKGTPTSFSSGTTTQTSVTYQYTYPPCYEPKEPCENCSYKDKCTKRLKPLPAPYWPNPYYHPPIWYYDPTTIPTC